MGHKVRIVDGNMLYNFYNFWNLGSVEDAPVWGVDSIFNIARCQEDGAGKCWDQFWNLIVWQYIALLIQQGMRTDVIIWAVAHLEIHCRPGTDGSTSERVGNKKKMIVHSFRICQPAKTIDYCQQGWWVWLDVRHMEISTAQWVGKTKDIRIETRLQSHGIISGCRSQG